MTNQINKSELFKSAWKLVKENGLTLSKALRVMWVKLRHDVSKVYIAAFAKGFIIPLKTKGHEIFLRKLLNCKNSFFPRIVFDIFTNSDESRPDKLEEHYWSLID